MIVPSAVSLSTTTSWPTRAGSMAVERLRQLDRAQRLAGGRADRQPGLGLAPRQRVHARAHQLGDDRRRCRASARARRRRAESSRWESSRRAREQPKKKKIHHEQHGHRAEELHHRAGHPAHAAAECDSRPIPKTRPKTPAKTTDRIAALRVSRQAGQEVLRPHLRVLTKGAHMYASSWLGLAHLAHDEPQARPIAPSTPRTARIACRRRAFGPGASNRTVSALIASPPGAARGW